MIIATTQDLELVGNCGCPCDLVVCDEPRKECESITTDACGYLLPDHEGLADEEKCLLFTKKNVSERVEYSFSDETTTINSDELAQTTWQKWDDGTTCDVRLFSTTYDETETNVVVIDGETTSDQSTVIHLQSGIGQPCNGSVTYTDGVDPENSYTDTLDSGCVSIDFSPDGTYTYASHTYTQTSVVGDTTTTISISYTDQVTAAILAEQLERKIALIEEGDPWPETECVSKVTETKILDDEDNVICRQVDSAQKARYRFGVPAGFSTTEHPRSTYEAQWDVGFFPDGWDSGDPEAPVPSIVESKSWIWGGNMEDLWSDWYEIPVPDGPGESRVVNLMVICYRSSRIGQKPTAFGEIYAFGD